MRTLIKFVAAVQVLMVITMLATVTFALEETPLVEKDPTEILEGLLIDQSSFLAGKTENITVGELKNINRTSAVFGVALKQKDGAFKFFPFDANGQVQSSDVLNNYPSGESVKVTVAGVVNGETINVVTVTEKLDEKSYAGILIDKKDFDASKGDPTGITRASLQATDKIASGFGVAVKQPDGRYSYFKLDDNSQISASEIIAATRKERNISVIAHGTWNGTLLQASSVVEASE
jgi:hypothetical protein